MKTLITIVLMSTCFLATATEVVWDNGGASTDWNDALNWDTDVIPSATDSIEIPTGFTVVIPAAYLAISGHMNNEGDLTINGTLTINGINAQGFSNRNLLTVNGSLLIKNLIGSSTYNALINALDGIVTNNGTIEIDNADGALVINSATFENNGDLILSNTSGGSNGISNSSIFNNNTGAKITMQTTGQLFNSGNLFNDAGARIEILQSLSFGIQNQDTLSNNGVIDVSFSNASGITNGEYIVNNGTIDIDQSGSRGITQSQDETKFENNGTLNITQSASDGIINGNSTSFHNTATGNVSIALNVGSGIVNRHSSSTVNDTLSFVNEGVLTISDNGFSGISNTTSNVVTGIGRVILMNSGTIDIISCVNSALISNSHRSTIENSAAGTVTLTRTVSTVFPCLENPSSTNHDPTILNQGNIIINNGELGNSHNFSNEGNVTITSSEREGITNSSVNAVFINSGTIQLSSIVRYGVNNINGSVFTNSTTGIIEIDTTGLSGVGNAGATFNNHGLIDVDDASSFACIENRSSNTTTGLFENHGNITAASSQSATGVWNRDGGLFQNKTTGQITINALGGANRGINNSGTSSRAATFENEGIISLTDNFLQNSAGTFTNLEGASIYGKNLINFNSFIPSLFTNAGTLTFDEDLENSEDFVNQSTGIVNVGATMLGGNAILNNGTFSGEGIINIATGTQAMQINSATWSPGFSPGTITINGDADFSASTTSYQVELENALDHDETIVNGDLTLGGILDVSLLNGFVPGATDLFPIFTFSGTLTGTFSTINLPSPEMDGWIVNYGTFSPGEVVIGPASILPVVLSTFQAEVMNTQDVNLNWQTASETNNSHFEIERSQNGIDYENIGSVEGSGTSYTEHDYGFVDNSPFPGISYYRLKQIDIDGIFEYSETRSVQINATSMDVLVYPNPTSDRLNIRSAIRILSMTLYNAEGKGVLSIQGDQKSADVSKLIKGHYYLQIITINGDYKKVVVIL